MEIEQDKISLIVGKCTKKRFTFFEIVIAHLLSPCKRGKLTRKSEKRTRLIFLELESFCGIRWGQWHKPV